MSNAPALKPLECNLMRIFVWWVVSNDPIHFPVLLLLRHCVYAAGGGVRGRDSTIQDSVTRIRSDGK